MSVFRPEEKVFAPETLASFEGMPVTNDHPPDGVDVDNIRRLQMGHAHNILVLILDIVLCGAFILTNVLSKPKQAERQISESNIQRICELTALECYYPKTVFSVKGSTKHARSGNDRSRAMTKAGAKISLLYGSHILYGQITCAHRLVNDGPVALFFHGNGNTDRFLKKNESHCSANGTVAAHEYAHMRQNSGQWKKPRMKSMIVPMIPTFRSSFF